MCILIALGIFILWWLLQPITTGCGRNVIVSQAISDARQIGMALVHFEKENGQFPDAQTIQSVISQVPLYKTENPKYTFSYLSGLTPEGDLRRPILVAPLIPGTDRFDPKPFNGKAMVLHVDTTVKFEIIDKQGHAKQLGRNLLDPTHPMWAGKPPTIIHLK
jgi:hypothetical protein